MVVVKVILIKNNINTDLQLNVKLNNPNLKVDDALDIQITISGKGNLQELFKRKLKIFFKLNGTGTLKTKELLLKADMPVIRDWTESI